MYIDFSFGNLFRARAWFLFFQCDTMVALYTYGQCGVLLSCGLFKFFVWNGKILFESHESEKYKIILNVYDDILYKGIGSISAFRLNCKDYRINKYNKYFFEATILLHF